MGIRVMKEGRIFLYKGIRKAGPQKKKKWSVSLLTTTWICAFANQFLLMHASVCTFDTHVHSHTNVNVSTYTPRRDGTDSTALLSPSGNRLWLFAVGSFACLHTHTHTYRHSSTQTHAHWPSFRKNSSSATIAPSL